MPACTCTSFFSSSAVTALKSTAAFTSLGPSSCMRLGCLKVLQEDSPRHTADARAMRQGQYTSELDGCQNMIHSAVY